MGTPKRRVYSPRAQKAIIERHLGGSSHPPGLYEAVHNRLLASSRSSGSRGNKPMTPKKASKLTERERARIPKGAYFPPREQLDLEGVRRLYFRRFATKSSLEEAGIPRRSDVGRRVTLAMMTEEADAFAQDYIRESKDRLTPTREFIFEMNKTIGDATASQKFFIAFKRAYRALAE